MHRHPPFNYDLKTYTYVGGFLFLCCEKHDKSFDPYDRRFRTKFRAAFDGKRLIINCDGRKKSYTINHQSNLNYILYRTSYNLMDYSNGKCRRTLLLLVSRSFSSFLEQFDFSRFSRETRPYLFGYFSDSISFFFCFSSPATQVSIHNFTFQARLLRCLRRVAHFDCIALHRIRTRYFVGEMDFFFFVYSR